MQLLLVEDDHKLAKSLILGLQQEGWQVTHCDTGEEALVCLGEATFTAVVLDWMLPGLSGLAVLERMNPKDRPQILMLTANIAIDDRVRGLDAGAADYLVKPFAFAELAARLRALIRRPLVSQLPTRQVGDLYLDYASRSVFCQGQQLELTMKEFQLLDLFMRHEGRVITRSIIADELWGLTFELGSNIIEVHVGNLRRKLVAAGGKAVITTRRGIGYTFSPAEAKPS